MNVNSLLSSCLLPLGGFGLSRAAQIVTEAGARETAKGWMLVGVESSLCRYFVGISWTRGIGLIALFEIFNRSIEQLNKMAFPELSGISNPHRVILAITGAASVATWCKIIPNFTGGCAYLVSALVIRAAFYKVISWTTIDTVEGK